MRKPLRLLVVEDSEPDALLLVRELYRGGYEPVCKRVCTKSEMAEALRGNPWDVVISDYSMPEFDGLSALTLLKESGLDVPFIIVSGTIGEERAVSAVKAGASDYIPKDDLTRLIPAIERELQSSKNRGDCKRAAEALATAEGNFRNLVEQCAVGLYVIQDERFVYVNPAMTSLFGCSSQDLRLRPLLDFIAPGDQDLAAQKVRERIEGTAKSVCHTLHVVRHDGTIIPVRIHDTKIDFSGRPAILGVMIED